MRMLLVITDEGAMRELERALLEGGERGFTIAPRVYGRGKSGMHAGDRVHPGASSMLFTVVPESDLDETLGLLRAARDRAGAAAVTKIYSLPAEELA
jgi:hypothetical protein